MSDWQIVKWSRAAGRGLIESPHYKDVPFDGSCADVDDFTIGEAVGVKLEVRPDGVKVKRIWPDIAHFKPLAGALPTDLMEEICRAAAEQTLAAAGDLTDYRFARLDDAELVLSRYDYSDESEHELLLQEPSYIDLRIDFVNLKELRLAAPAERDYLVASKFADLRRKDVALTFIDGGGHFYFAIGKKLGYRAVSTNQDDVADDVRRPRAG